MDQVILDLHRVLARTTVIVGWLVENAVSAFVSGWVGGSGDELLGEA
jgi:hypothetical protein